MFSAVIHLTDFGESPRRAITGIIANKEKVGELHFIYPTYQDDKRSMYADWHKDKKELLDAGIKVYFDATLNAKKFNSDLIILEIPPFCEIKLGGFDLLEKTAKSAKDSQTHFSMNTVSIFSGISPWYGFLVVLTTIDWIWNRLFEFGKLLQYTNVRGRFIVKKGNRAFFPADFNFTWRFWNNGIMRDVFKDGSAVIKPGKFSSWEYLEWVLNTHLNLKFGLWIFPFLSIYMVLVLSWVAMVSSQMTTLTIYATTIWILEVTFSFFICKTYLKINYLVVYSFLFPLYFILFPFFLIYAKFTVPKKTWDN